MGRLKNVPSRLSVGKSRLNQEPPSADRRVVKRDDVQPWRKLYKLARWVKLRAKLLIRDQYTCQQSGVLLTGKYPAWNSPVCDHIIPVKIFWYDGRQHLFWEESNLQIVSKQYHDAEKQRQDQLHRY